MEIIRDMLMRTLSYAQFAQILNLSLIIKLEVFIIAGLRRTETQWKHNFGACTI